MNAPASARVVRLRVPASRTDELSDEIWEVPGVQGIEEAPPDGAELFGTGDDFAVLEFGSDAARRCAEWLEQDAYRGGGEIVLKVYLDVDVGPASGEALLEALSFPKGVTVDSTEVLQPVDYLEEYKRTVKGAPVGKHLWVGPPWDAPPPDREPFFVEPGLAFGTGDHPTTRMCLERLEELQTSRSFVSVLDLGTGTGVLAAACRRFFPSASILATDLDPLCEAELAKTFRLNGMAANAVEGRWGNVGTAHSLAREGLAFELIVSNIYAEILVEIAADLRSLARPGTLWLASGILEEKGESLIEAAKSLGWRINYRKVEGVERPELTAAQGLSRARQGWLCLEFVLDPKA